MPNKIILFVRQYKIFYTPHSRRLPSTSTSYMRPYCVRFHSESLMVSENKSIRVYITVSGGAHRHSQTS